MALLAFLDNGHRLLLDDEPEILRAVRIAKLLKVFAIVYVDTATTRWIVHSAILHLRALGRVWIEYEASHLAGDCHFWIAACAATRVRIYASVQDGERL